MKAELAECKIWNNFTAHILLYWLLQQLCEATQDQGCLLRLRILMFRDKKELIGKWASL